MTIEDKAQAYDEAIRKAQDVYHTSEFVKITDLFPELADNEDEKIRKTLSVLVQNAIYPGLITEEDSKKCLTYLEKQKERGPLTKDEEYTLHRIIEYLEDETCPSEWINLLHGIYCLPYGKQKESTEKEYVFRPLGGTDITVAAEQAIKRVNEGERLVLAFNGAYIPVIKGYDVNEIVDIYNTFVKKRKEPPFVKDVNVGYPGHYFYDGERMYLCSSPDLEEKQKEQKLNPDKEKLIRHCIGLILTDATDERFKDYGLTLKDCLTWLSEQKEQKPVVTHGETYHVDTLGTQQVIAGKMPQKPVECIEFDNEFEKQVSHLLASILNGEWEYNEDFVKYAAQSLLGYAKHELELDGKALLYTADKSYQIGFRDGVASVKQEWSKEDEAKLKQCIEIVSGWEGDYDIVKSPYSKFLKSLPERLNLQPKQEWGENDEAILSWCISDIERAKRCASQTKPELCDIEINWLKSLKPRWKPSEEQMEALEKVRHSLHTKELWAENNPVVYAYESLMRDLQKLM